jgi:hypothetical protein
MLSPAVDAVFFASIFQFFKIIFSQTFFYRNFVAVNFNQFETLCST